MDETELINRIFELYTEADRTFEKYVLYGGLIDSELNILQAKEMKPENMQPKEAFTNLMHAYKSAIALKEACEIYYKSNFLKNQKCQQWVDNYDKIADKIVEQAEVFINHNLKKLPETLHKKTKKLSLLERLGIKK